MRQGVGAISAISVKERRSRLLDLPAYRGAHNRVKNCMGTRLGSVRKLEL